MDKKTDFLSMVTTPIVLFNNETPVCYGTGFYYSTKWGGHQNTFLVTNYHVITGNDDVKERKELPKGDRLMFFTHIDEKNVGTVLATIIPIKNETQNLWLEHDNKAVDIAILPIVYKLPVESPMYGIDDNLRSVEKNISPSDLVTLVGYPRMFCDKINSLPVYKTGHVASEYDYDFNGDPCFLIDISAFGGNSGSPVFAIDNAFKVESGELKLYEKPTKNFLGIYSSQYELDETLPIEVLNLQQSQLGVSHTVDMQLGVVWKGYLIEQIISAPKPEEYIKRVEAIFKTSPFKFKITKGFEDI